MAVGAAPDRAALPSGPLLVLEEAETRKTEAWSSQRFSRGWGCVRLLRFQQEAGQPATGTFPSILHPDGRSCSAQSMEKEGAQMVHVGLGTWQMFAKCGS